MDEINRKLEEFSFIVLSCQEEFKYLYDQEGNLIFKDVTNLMRRVGLRTKVKGNSLLYDTYDVKEGETPELNAHKLYGDTELHWIVLLVNEITDRYHQWPMSGMQFLDYINDK